MAPNPGNPVEMMDFSVGNNFFIRFSRKSLWIGKST